MKLALIYNHACPHTTGAYIEKAIRDAGIHYDRFGIKDPSCIPEGFDLYLRIDHGDYKFDIPAHLRPAVFYAIDTHLPKPYRKMRAQARHYDIIFCAQKSGADRLRRDTGADTQWLPLASDPAVHCQLDVPKEYDIGFVGRNAAKFARGRHLVELNKRYPRSFIGQADYRDMARIYSASRIGFNSSIMNDINMRVFEIMSCGCFLLTNAIRDNGFRELFCDGRDLVTYRTDREMFLLIDHYLAHEREREAIAAAGRRLVNERHTYFHRVQSMFNYIAYKFGGGFNALRI
ncbi:MAG TPA: glycosyltransferase [Candidatus Omnitrophota bacterium]|nr:glycosyltransferase [Candidatus Omnitrophota bacterium]